MCQILRLCVKFEVSSFICPGDIRGPEHSQNSKIPKIQKVGHVTATWPFLIYFFRQSLTGVNLCAKFEVSSFIHPEILGGPKNAKVGHVTPSWPLLTQFCIFLPHVTPFELVLHFFR